MLNTQEIERIIETTLRSKMEHYRPEASDMPFHTRPLGNDRMALFRFIHSLNTRFGTGIFEPVAAEVARGHFTDVKLQHNVGDKFSEEAQSEIARIIGELTNKFWDFLAGNNEIYNELLDCFERVGCRLRGDIDDYFKRFGM